MSTGESESSPFGVLLDIDGVLYVGDQPIEGAVEALGRLRQRFAGMRLVTNTTSRPRREVTEHLLALGFPVSGDEVLTPAAMAVRHCQERGFHSIAMLVSDSLREDLEPLQSSGSSSGRVEALILGDIGARFNAEVLNDAFRLLMDGAELIALQHNRYWRRADGLALDVGAYAAALEYATAREAVVVGKPAREFFHAAVADMGLQRAVMIGDDVEADVGGAMAADMPGVLVRTGKYRDSALPASGVTPTAVADSIKDVPELLERLLASQGGAG
jgi:HAD superfamily hydrolase (TIGR01458 family)